MYECQSCGHRFETPKEHNEWHEVGDARFPEAVLGCPRCGGGYIELPEAEPAKDEAEEKTEEGEVIHINIKRYDQKVEILISLAENISLVLEQLPFEQFVIVLGAIFEHRLESEKIDIDENISALIAKVKEAQE